MERKVAIGLTRTGEPVYANLEFLDGTRGAHASISGVSGVATKTSTHLPPLFAVPLRRAGPEATNTKAIIFNVKGEDLLWLDRPNTRLDDEGRAEYPGSACPWPIPKRGALRARGRGSTPCRTPAADKKG